MVDFAIQKLSQLFVSSKKKDRSRRVKARVLHERSPTMSSVSHQSDPPPYQEKERTTLPSYRSTTDSLVSSLDSDTLCPPGSLRASPSLLQVPKRQGSLLSSVTLHEDATCDFFESKWIPPAGVDAMGPHASSDLDIPPIPTIAVNNTSWLMDCASPSDSSDRGSCTSDDDMQTSVSSVPSSVSTCGESQDFQPVQAIDLSPMSKLPVLPSLPGINSSNDAALSLRTVSVQKQNSTGAQGPQRPFKGQGSSEQEQQPPSPSRLIQSFTNRNNRRNGNRFSESTTGSSSSQSRYTRSSSGSLVSDVPDYATMLKSGDEVWVFPRLTLSCVLEYLRTMGAKIEDVGQSYSPGSGASPDGKRASTCTSSTGGSTTTNNARKRRRGARSGDAGPSKAPRTAVARSARGGKTGVKRYGCPFAKHRPDRYEGVFNCCTAPPGFEWKYVIEHLKRVHSASSKCIYCDQYWQSAADWEAEMIEHINSGQCRQARQILSKPECMTATQEAVYKRDSNERALPEQRWISLYMRLFPGEYPIPNPVYDYYQPRHRITTYSHTNEPAGSGTAHRSRQRVWYAFTPMEEGENLIDLDQTDELDDEGLGENEGDGLPRGEEALQLVFGGSGLTAARQAHQSTDSTGPAHPSSQPDQAVGVLSNDSPINGGGGLTEIDFTDPTWTGLGSTTTHFIMPRTDGADFNHLTNFAATHPLIPPSYSVLPGDLTDADKYASRLTAYPQWL